MSSVLLIKFQKSVLVLKSIQSHPTYKQFEEYVVNAPVGRDVQNNAGLRAVLDFQRQFLFKKKAIARTTRKKHQPNIKNQGLMSRSPQHLYRFQPSLFSKHWSIDMSAFLYFRDYRL